MFNKDSILDSLMHRNDKIYLYCQQIWCGLWRSSVCVLLVCIVYILCIDFVQSIDYFISTILSDRKIKSPKNNSVDFIVASRINQGFVWAIHNAVFCRLRVWVFIELAASGNIPNYSSIQAGLSYAEWVMLFYFSHVVSYWNANLVKLTIPFLPSVILHYVESIFLC